MKDVLRSPAVNPWLLLIVALALLVMALVKILVEWPFAVQNDPSHGKEAG